jgi:hypothetical protein
MASDRFTITIPKEMASRVRKRARKERKPISRVIADDLEIAERARMREEMVEGARASSALNKQIAEEFWPIAGETWPVD